MNKSIACWTLAGALLAGGCGKNELLRTQGRVVKGDQAFIPEEGHWLRIQFIPVSDDGKPPEQLYAAEVDNDTGTFRPWGPMKAGMPPGRYRVSVELMNKKKKDLFDGKYALDSPYVFDVDGETEEIVVDLDSPPENKERPFVSAEEANAASAG